MGLATVFFIPSNIEPFCWLAIFLFCAYMIARACATGRFVHGLLLGLANCVWITAAHVLLFGQYLAHHAQESAMLAKTPLPTHPRLMMAIGGPIIGLISGIIIGLFALVAGKLMKSNPAAKAKAMGQSA